MKYPIVICICIFSTLNLLCQVPTTYTDSLLLRFDSLLTKRLDERDIQSSQLAKELSIAKENFNSLNGQLKTCQTKSDSTNKVIASLQVSLGSIKSDLEKIKSDKQNLEEEWRLSIQNQLALLTSAPSNFPDKSLNELEKQVSYFSKKSIPLTGEENIKAFREQVFLLSKADSLLNYFINDVKEIDPIIQALDRTFNNRKIKFIGLQKEYEAQKMLLTKYLDHLQDVRCRILEIAIVKGVTVEEKQAALDNSGFNLRTMDGYGFLQKKLDAFYQNPNIDNMSNIKGLNCE